MQTPEKHITRRGMLALTAAAAAGLALDACSSSGSSSGAAAGAGTSVSQAEIDKAMKTPTTLTFWTWVPDISKEVAVFEKQYPAIKINVVNPGQGTPLYTKLRTALDAGKGTPDLSQVEYQYIPTFALLKGFVDLRPYGAAANAGKFVDWVWRQVTGPNGEIYAYPQDTGPMGMLYRADIFAKHGISVPATWDEFATAAHKLHAADPGSYLTNMADNEVAAWHGLMWQAGSRPYTVHGTTVGLALDDAPSKKVADYWGGLVADGVISTDPDFTSNWYQGLNTGRYASWLTGAWGPAFLAGAIKSTAGKWRAAPLPQWDSGQQVAGNWGGSTNAVIKGTQHPIAAAKFAEFLNTNPTTTAMFNTQQSLFPSLKSLLSSASFASYKSPFFGGQPANKLFAQISSTVNVNWEWPPFLDQSITDWTATVGKALGSKGNVATATTQWNSQLATYAKAQGFHVTTS
jgi:multiple sugar transport system substrate-binding protein